MREQRNSRHRLKALLLRNGIAYSGRTSWTPAHLRWLASLKLPHPTQQIAFQEYRFPARVSLAIAQCQVGCPKPITDIALEAQVRLCARYKRLAARRLPANKIVVVIARELAGFIWAVALKAAPSPQTAA